MQHYKRQLTEGVNFHLEDLDENIRKRDAEEVYRRGNHKSAEQNEDFLTKAL